ncbi:MAG: pilus assembly protein CpaB [Desulfovibrionales bacterium]|nr:pilus assembly protein CpaB [Desulfovibrionales bacterium]
MSRGVKMALQLGLALSVALVAGVFIFRWMNVKSAQAVRVSQANAAATVRIAVAVKALPRGTKIQGGDVALKPFLKESLPEGGFQDAGPLKDRILLVDLGPNEPVTEAKLAPEGAASLGVAGMIHPGKRAMAVRGNEVLGLGGFVHPGDRVDVLVTLDGVGTQRNPKTKLVLENIPVLATGTELSPSRDGDKPSPVDIYTLEVSPDESEILALAATKGSLHFALRGDGDGASVLTTGKDAKAALSALLADSDPSPGARVRRKPKPTVELITGATRTTITFGRRSSVSAPKAKAAPSPSPLPPVKGASLALGELKEK